MPERPRQRLAAVRKETAGPRPGRYHFKLFVTGATARSTLAITHLTRFCQEKLSGRYKLEVFDIYQQPNEARKERVMVAPTLVRVSPSPHRCYTGDFSDRARLTETLGAILRTAFTRSRANAKAKIKTGPPPG